MPRPAPTLCLTLIASLAACAVRSERLVPLPSHALAVELGPLPAKLARPKFLLAADAESAVLQELVPYQSVELLLEGSRAPDSCAHFAIDRLITDRPDAILVYPEASKVTGVQNSVVYLPFTGMVSFATPSSSTAVVGYAMRAARARLPFDHDLVTGMVMTIHDQAACADLLEGDTVTRNRRRTGATTEALAGVDPLPSPARAGSGRRREGDLDPTRNRSHASDHALSAGSFATPGGQGQHRDALDAADRRPLHRAVAGHLAPAPHELAPA